MGLPYEQQAAIEAVIGALYHLQSPPGPYGKRIYSLIFRDLPDRREYPDYYLFIKEPRSLNDISESLRQGRYSSPQGVAYDLLLIWSNAREYNQQGSQVYADADTLEQYMSRVWRERTPPLPPFESLPRPGSLAIPTSSIAPTPAPAPDTERKVKRLKLTGASLGSSATKIRIGGPAAPPAPTPSPAPTPAITLKLGGRTAASNVPPSAASADLPALPSLHLPTLPVHPPVASTSAYVSSETQAPENGSGERATSAAPQKKKKSKQSVDPEGDVDGEELQSVPQMPTFPDPESGWMDLDASANATERYLEIVNKIRDHTDVNDRQLALPLLDLPDRAARPDYYSIVSNPIALNTIEAKVRQGAYRDPEAFDRDLFHLFETAKRFIHPETPGTLYSDLLVLQRLYHELTKRGAESDADVSASATTPVPGIIKREEGVSGESEAKVGKATTRPTLKDKVLLDSINFKGEVLQVGDWIFLSNSQNPGKPIIAQIWQTYKKADSHERCLSVCWYNRPEDTWHPASRQFYENEVFKTGKFIDHHVEEYMGRCFVMFFTKYTRGRPRPPAWTPKIPLYVCEYRYKEETQSFKKIKSWVSCVPEQVRQHEYDFEPYADDHVDVLVKVKSPLLRGVSGRGGLDKDNNYTFSQDGVPITAAEEAERAEQPVMDLDVQPLDSLDLSASFAAASSTPLGTGAESSLAAFDASLLAAPSPAYLASSTPTPAELDTTDFFTPLPSALKSKFRNDALGDLLWFGAPAATPPVVAKPTHSLAYLYWRVQREQAATNV